jgi:hypothetical protein
LPKSVVRLTFSRHACLWTKDALVVQAAADSLSLTSVPGISGNDPMMPTLHRPPRLRVNRHAGDFAALMIDHHEQHQFISFPAR